MKRFLIVAALLVPFSLVRGSLVFEQPHTGTGALLASSRFQAQAGKLYWVRIDAEMGNGLPHWGLATGTGNGSYFRRLPAMFFQFPPGDAAFGLVTSDGPTFTIAASASPAGSGTIANAGLYATGDTVALVATPAAGYQFTGCGVESHRQPVLPACPSMIPAPGFQKCFGIPNPTPARQPI